VLPQGRVGRHDGRHLPQDSATKSLARRREASALVVGQPEAAPLQLLLEDVVLLDQVLDDLLLVAIDPSSEGHEQQPYGGEIGSHRPIVPCHIPALRRVPARLSFRTLRVSACATSTVMDADPVHRRSLLTTALVGALLLAEVPEARMLRGWLDSWSGVGLHPPLQPDPQTGEVEVLRPRPSNHYHFGRYGPLVSADVANRERLQGVETHTDGWAITAPGLCV
jgi:hypothetical protein